MINRYKIPLSIFVFYFLSSLTIGLLIQLIILPYIIPHLHAGNGLLIKGDWNLFHILALQIKEAVDQEGWGAFNLFYRGQAPAGIAGFFYLLIYPKPFSVLPINCLFHALGGLTLFFIIRNLSKNNLISFLSSSVFVFFPSSILWYSQIHKDTFYNPAILMFILSWLIFISFINQKRNNFLILSSLLILISFVTIFICRPYYLKVFYFINIILTFSILINIILKILSKQYKLFTWFNIFKIILFLTLINLVALFTEVIDFSHSSAFKKNVTTILEDKDQIGITGNRVVIFLEPGEENKINEYNQKKSDKLNPNKLDKMNLSFDSCTNGKILTYNVVKGERTDEIRVVNCEYKVKKYWKKTEYFPSKLDYFLEQIFYYREYFLMLQANANMTFGQNYPLNSFIEMIKYVPKAFYYGYLSPFPSDWVSQGSTEATTVMKKIISLEMIVFYLLIPFILYQILKKYNDLRYFAIFIICNTFVLLPTYVVPNVGVMVRHRYACFTLLIAIGISIILKNKLINKSIK